MINTRNILSATFHVIALIHNVHAIGYCHFSFKENVEEDDGVDQRILDMKNFGMLFFTSWNMIIQILYFSLAVLSDILRFSYSKSTLIEKILRLRGYFYTSMLFPCSIFVCTMFWGVYSINREWVLPSVLDKYVPDWLNHCLHTNIIIFLTIEVLLVNQFIPSYKSSLLGLTVLTLIYDTIFFATYFLRGRWIYGIFHFLSWPERIFFMLFNYLIVLMTMRIGIVIENFKYNQLTKNKKYTSNS
ncbi:androgen-dependent TFPI-regulating protein-like isoform X1 [Cylas formicarius]|uniref:androgen-dependent TFPI-regulating protein-like isoform X1 n=1 Tax=Cylas formicarius TaxID=197179 RepID=UPI0029586219|nr:androgen-dependent TFPI-regulating protein-like isoform X1 [Cylas formicarius]XP_060531401.1 androgen-dependent TFPI-regulating protein-like isoform X1 [Cylas formicarius]